jgi:hypothetical protein
VWPTRAWCLAEFVAARAAQAPVELALPPRELAPFLDGVVRDPGRVLAQLAALPPPAAAASDPDDAAALHAWLADAGPARVAADLAAVVRSWLLRTVQQRQAALTPSLSAPSPAAVPPSSTDC